MKYQWWSGEGRQSECPDLLEKRWENICILNNNAIINNWPVSVSRRSLHGPLPGCGPSHQVHVDAAVSWDPDKERPHWLLCLLHCVITEDIFPYFSLPLFSSSAFFFMGTPVRSLLLQSLGPSRKVWGQAEGPVHCLQSAQAWSCGSLSVLYLSSGAQPESYVHVVDAESALFSAKQPADAPAVPAAGG